MFRFLGQLDKKKLANKKVLLRVDFDVPLAQLPTTNYPRPTADAVSGLGQLPTKIGEDFRIKAQKETIDYLVDCGAKVLLVSHLGHDDPSASFLPIVEEIGEILGHTLTLVPHSELGNVDKLFETIPILLLENIRQDEREIQNDDGLAEELANGFDYYVNDAFAVCHRDHTSVSAITKHLPSYAGFLIKKEIENLGQAMGAPAEGKVLIIGGAKISTKLPVIKNFLDKAEKILVGGAIANNFFKSRGITIGLSVVDDAVSLDFESDKILLPVDMIVSNDKTGMGEIKMFDEIKDIAANERILDIGPKTRDNFSVIIKNSKITIWNGPMGLSEVEAFAGGTRAIADALVTTPYSIIGGGDTIVAVDKMGLLSHYGFVSTGGGAMLEFLANNRLPGLAVLGYYD